MSIQFSQKGSKLFYKLTGSYIILLLIVITMFWPLYLKTLRSVKDEAVKDYYSIFGSGFEALDHELTDINQTIFNLYTDANTKYLSMLSNDLEPHNYYRITVIQKYFNALFRPINIVQDSFMIFLKNDIVLGRKRVFNLRENFYNDFLLYEGMDYEEWISRTLTTKSKEEFWPEQTVYNYDYGYDEVVTYLLTLPVESMKYYDSVAIVMLSKKEMLELLYSENIGESGWLYIQDLNGNIILKHNYMGDVLVTANNGFSETRIDGVDTTVMYRTSLENRIKVVIGIPNHIFVESVKPVRNLLLLYFTIALLGALMVSVTFSYLQSQPWRNLLKYIEGISDAGDIKNGEYEYIRNSIEVLSKSKEQLYEKLVSQQNTLVAGLFERLIRNGIYTADDLKMVRQYLDHLPDYYRLVIIRILVPESTKNKSDLILSEANEVVRILAMNILSEIFGDNIIIHPTDKSQIVIVIEQPENSDRGLEKLESRLINVYNTVNKKCGVNTVFGISGKHRGIENVATAFNEGQQVLRYVDEYFSKPVLCFDSLPKQKKGSKLEYQESQKLYHLLLLGEKQAVLDILDTIFNNNIQDAYLSTDDLQQLFFSIRGIIMCAYRDMNLEENKLNIPGYHEIKTIQEIFTDLKASCIEICDQLDNQKRSHNRKLRNDIVEFIANNFSRQEMCADWVADQFGISLKYMFNFIKEQTGITFGQYVEKLRLECAIKLMQETRLSINEIALRAGFGSQNTFYKTFKRVYGVSPSAWRTKFENR